MQRSRAARPATRPPVRSSTSRPGARASALALVPVLALSLAADPTGSTAVTAHAAHPGPTRPAETDRTAETGWFAPVPGEVVHRVSLPARPWMPGHRGVDLAAPPGAAVRAPTAGTVTFAGQVAGRPVLVVSHGALRSTFEPVDAVVPVGTVVDAGDQVAVVAADDAGHCAPTSCLHWGVRRGETYLDPLLLLGTADPIVLLPSG